MRGWCGAVRAAGPASSERAEPERRITDRTGRGMFQNASSCVYYVLVHQLGLSRKPKITVQLHTTPEY